MPIAHPENLESAPTDRPIPAHLAAEGVVRIAGDGAQFNATGFLIGPAFAAAREAERRGLSIVAYMRLADAAASVDAQTTQP
jgi:hypothetical protein